MKYNNLTFADPVLPTLKLYKELNPPYKQPFGGTIITMVPLAPTETVAIDGRQSITIGQDISQNIQKAIHRKGILVTAICEGVKNYDNYKNLKVGDFIFTRQGANPESNKLVTDEKTGQKFILSVFNINDVLCTVETPDYTNIGDEAMQIANNEKR